MADIRIKDLPTTASLTSSGDFIAIDGNSNGTRKLSAATPAFLTSVTTPSLTSPAATNLTLATGSFGTALTVASATGNVGIGTTAPLARLSVQLVGTSPAGYSAATNSGITLDCGTNDNGVINLVGGGSLGIFRSNSSNAYDTGIAFGTNAVRNMSFNTANAERVVISATGEVSIASTTAGSSGAGALVVAGGISAGQSAQASWFGGAVTVTGNAATTASLTLNNPSGSAINQYYANFTAGATVIARALRGNGVAGYSDNGLNIDNFGGFQIGLNVLGGSGESFKIRNAGTTDLLTIASTGAATFAGSITVTTNQTHVLGAGGSTASELNRIVLNGSSGAAAGSTIYLQSAGVNKSYIGRAGSVLGGTSDNLLLYSVADNVVIYGGATLAATFSSTAATFAGAVTATGSTTISSTNDAFLKIARAANGDIGHIQLFTGATADWQVGLRQLSTSDFYIYSYGTGTNVLTIARATGAATFAGGVAVTGALSTTGTQSMMSGATTVSRSEYQGLTSVAASATSILPAGLGYGALCIVNGYESGNQFADVVAVAGTTATALFSGTVSGSPTARTYTVVSNVLKLSMASGTYTVMAKQESLNAS
jgi:hypothetical protein